MAGMGLLVFVGVLLLSEITATRQSEILELEEKYRFGALEEVPINYGEFSFDGHDIELIKEDRYRPGSFLISVGGGILRFTPGQPLTHFLGNITDKRYLEGNAAIARFSAIPDFVQYNKSKIAIADFSNHCVREYDMETDIVQPLFGSCANSTHTLGYWYDGLDAPADSHFLLGTLGVVYVESENYFITCDFGYGQLTMYNVSTGRVQGLLSAVEAFELGFPSSLLLNSEGNVLYVAQNFELVKIDLVTRRVMSLVGEQQEISSLAKNQPLHNGPFTTASVGRISHLSWLVDGKVLVASGGTNKALVVVNLVEKIILTSCPGTQKVNETIVGPQNTCSFSNLVAVTASTTNTLYVITKEQSFSGSTTPAIFKIETDVQVKDFEDTPTYTVATNTVSSINARNLSSKILCPECPVTVSFGELVEVERHMGPYELRPMDSIVEDRYNRGTFFFNSGHTGKKLLANGTVQHLFGYEGQNSKDYFAGNSSTSRFALISGFVQYNRTILLIGDFLNNCIREWNYETDLIRQFIGKCNGSENSKEPLQPNEVKSADFDFLVGLISFVYARSRGIIITADLGFLRICKYDYATNTVQLLHADIGRSIMQPHNLLLSSDDNTLYVVHAYGLSKIDLDTYEVTLLVGQAIDDDGKTHVPFVAGPFSAAKVGLMQSLQWVVPDRLLVAAGTFDNEMLIFIDLKGERVYSACQGNVDSTETITGDVDVCALHSPTGVGVSINQTIYVATLTETLPRNYSFNSRSSLYKMKAYVSVCQFKQPTGNEIVDPSFPSFLQDDKVTISCPMGMALAAQTKIRICENDSTWDEPLPSCIPITSSELVEISPLVGQRSGGTPIKVRGYIPDVGLGVSIEVDNTTVRQLNFSQNDQVMSFTMPPQETADTVDLVLRLSDEVEERYKYRYMDDPIVKSVRGYTLAWGGFDILFTVANINSSRNYMLRSNERASSYRCTKQIDLVACDIGNTTLKKEKPKFFNMELISDGLVLEETNVTVYPNPQFEGNTAAPKRGADLELRGQFLDIGPLNKYYNITIQSGDEYAACIVVAITSDLIRCQPNFLVPPDSSPKRIIVTLGRRRMSAGETVFQPALKPSTEDSLSDSTTGIIAGVLSVLVIAIVLMALLLYRKYNQRRQLRRDPFIRIYREDEEWFVHINIDLKAKLDPLLIEPDSLKLKQEQPIGEGNFGKIYLGQLYQGQVVKTVAVKTLKDMDTPIPEIERFLEEAVILEDFRHANVLPTLAVCIPLSDKPQVVLPYMANGDLKSLIQMEHMKFTLGDLMHFAKQVACGMNYLAENKFVHRDLAARNCLVSDKYIVRIADFGLSRDIYNKDYYRRDETSGVALPVKWLAIESLISGRFTSQSDVWSYGVLVWELLTRGSQPYSDVDVWDMKNYLEEGRRLHQPKYCPPDIWQIMCSCWEREPNQRPTFAQLHGFFDKILEDTNCNPQSHYSYIRDYTKDIPSNYIDEPLEVEMQIEDYLVPVSSRKSRVMNDYPPLPSTA